MIDFRYHIVSIVAIFLALATGVALGAGPLKGTVDQSYISQAERDRQDKQNLRAQITTMQNIDDFHNAFVTDVAASLLAGRLQGRSVCLVALPGADKSTVDAARTSLTQAGARVSPTVSLSDALLDSQNKTLADSLASQLRQGISGIDATNDAGTYDLVGAILARALVTTAAGGVPADDSARNILSGFAGADLLSTDGDLARRCSLTEVVTGNANGPDEALGASDTIVLSIVRALDSASDGAVVAGPPAAALDGGVVAALRADGATSSEVSTIDVADEPSGAIAAVYALAEQSQGKSGQYGAVGTTDGPLPTLTAGNSP